jgi:hemoglobin/transferrin/lactoferrin receptor protein
MKKFILTPLAAAVLSASAYAADEAPKTFTFDKVTVSATLTEEKISDVANTVSVIDAEQIEKQQATNVRELFKYEPGVDISTQGRFGFNSINIRGADENQVKIVIDGVDQPKTFNASPTRFQASSRFALDMESLKQVEIVKGPASSIYGSNAIGGVVAFTTKDPADYLNPTGDDTHVSLKTAYYSVDDQTSATLTAANRSGRFESLISYTVRDGEETENMGTVGGEGSDRTKPNPLDTESNNILVKLQYQLNDNHRIGFTAEDYNYESEGDVLSSLSSTYSLFEGDDRTDRTRFSLEYSWDADLPVFDSLNTSLSHQKSKSQSITNNLITSGYGPVYGFPIVMPPFAVTNEPRTKDYSYEEEQIQLDSIFTKQLDSHTLTYGINIKQTDFESVSDTLFANYDDQESRWSPLADELIYGIFIQDKITLLDGKLTLSPSLRYDHYETKTKTDSAFTTDLDGQKEHNTSFRLGSVYDFSENLSVFAQYAQGFKTPDLEDLYQVFVNSSHGYATIGNPDLKPETSDSFEAGIRYSNNIGGIEVSAFYNDYDDYIQEITYYPTSGDYAGLRVTQDANIAKATIKGIEARGSVWLDEAVNAPVGTALHFSASYAKGKGQNDNEGGRTPLASIAPLKGVIGLAYDAPDNSWGGALDWTLVQRKKDTYLADETDFAPSGYGIVDLSVYYNITPQLSLKANIDNLTDKKYYLFDDVRGQAGDTSHIERYTQPGRNFSVSANYTF